MNKKKTDWRDVVLKVGKYRGKTLFWVYTNRTNYLYELKKLGISGAIEAIDHKNRVDPYFDNDYLNRGFRD
jgi:hypothetical protein